MEILQDFQIEYDIIVVNPNLHVSTKWAFEKLNIEEGSEKEPILKNVRVFDLSQKDKFVNDFEEIVFQKFDILKKVKHEFIEMGAVYSSMSGTGATMFGFFEKENRTLLRNCRDYYDKKRYFTFISE